MGHEAPSLWRVLAHPMNLAAFIVSGALVFLLPIAVAVQSVPGNTLAAQMEAFRARDIAALVIVAVFAGLFTAVRVAIVRTKRRGRGAAATCAAASGASGAFAGLIATATCASCLAPILGALGIGFGGTLLLLEYRGLIFTLTMIALAIALDRSLRQYAHLTASTPSSKTP